MGGNMNRKGFTLIELIGVVLIISLMFMVTFPNLIGVAKNDKEKQEQTLIKDICLAANTYIKSNSNVDPKNISIALLKGENLISDSQSNLGGTLECSLEEDKTYTCVYKSNNQDYNCSY